MVRRYEEPIEVRATTEQAVPGGATASGAVPDAFVWRGRLYVVRQVLDHWKERRPWWRDALDDARERQVWRVEASAGRLAGTGVYDLGVDPSPGQWRLLRVAD